MMKKGLLISGMAAVLVLGTALTSEAAGWSMENGKWVYYDNAGYLVTDDWKRGADDQWRYLNSYGEMAVDCWVDDSYYVDSNGIMVAGKWLRLETDRNGETEDEHWYYFTDNGKAAMETWKKINNKWYYRSEEHTSELQSPS